MSKHPVTHQQLRDAGYSVSVGELDETALRLLCAFNGVDPKLAPPAWWHYPNESSRAAWERVAAEAKRIFGPVGDIHV
jgi:hypothetical protein